MIGRVVVDWLAARLGYARHPRRELRARYDAASQTDETRKHWERADGLAADAAADTHTRSVLRNRGRYERFNNPYMAGGLRTLANDVVGIGPALQLLTPNEDVNAAVEKRFEEWSRAVHLAQKLRIMRQSRAADGEVFVRFVHNPRLFCPVKLDLQLIEGEQVATPMPSPDDNVVDGIELDELNNPIAYHILKQHPGARNTSLKASPYEFVRVPAADIIHYFLPERPGQHRGIPEVVSSLNLHAERRNYRGSVLTAARSAANLGAVVLSTNGPPDEDDPLVPMSSTEIEHGMMTVAPDGTTPYQIKAEQPATTYREFNEDLVNESMRPLNMPRNVALCDSSRYNYASGRLDHQTYDRSVVIDEDDLDIIVLSRVLNRWSILATSVQGLYPRNDGRPATYLPLPAEAYLPTERDPDWWYWTAASKWTWHERQHVDPQKSANAAATELESGTKTLAELNGRQRKDWRREIEQIGRERIAKDDAGILALDVQHAPRVLETLKNVRMIGREASIELLTLLGVPREKAERMVSGALKAAPKTPAATPDDDVPQRVTERMNGNGVAHA